MPFFHSLLSGLIAHGVPVFLIETVALLLYLGQYILISYCIVMFFIRTELTSRFRFMPLYLFLVAVIFVMSLHFGSIFIISPLNKHVYGISGGTAVLFRYCIEFFGNLAFFVPQALILQFLFRIKTDSMLRTSIFVLDIYLVHLILYHLTHNLWLTSR